MKKKTHPLHILADKTDFIEILAQSVVDESNFQEIEFCIDYDDNQTLLIEFGREVARRFLRDIKMINQKEWEIYERKNT